MTSAVILGMIVTMFREPREQAKAIGVYSFVASAGGSIGLLLGGVLTEAINWHWIFFVNLPIGLATGLFALRLVEQDEGLGFREGADVRGALYVTGALMLGVYTILEAGDQGWGSVHTVGLGSVAVALLTAFVMRQTRIPNPLMPLRLFRSRNVAGANAVQALFVGGMFGMFFLGALYLQRVLGYDALEVGLAFLPTTIVIGTLSLGFSERLNTRFGPRATLIPSLLFIGAGLLLFARTPVDGTYVTDVLPSMLLLGAGAGLAFPALMTLSMSGATPADAGLASGLVNTTLQVGGAIGLAVLTTFATERTDGLLADGESAASALTSGYHLAYLIGAGLVAVALVIVLTVMRPPGEAAPQAAEVEPAARSPRPSAAQRPRHDAVHQPIRQHRGRGGAHLRVAADEVAGARALRGERVADRLGHDAWVDPGLGGDLRRLLADRRDQAPVQALPLWWQVGGQLGGELVALPPDRRLDAAGLDHDHVDSL
jgi:MFS family permease